MEKTLFQVAIILISTKLLGLLSRKIKMPEVLGALVAGVLIGPSIFNIIEYDSNLTLLSNLGVILLMFLAGLETDLEKLKKAGLSAFLIACGGILLPLMLGTLFTDLIISNLTESAFIGVILTATSVSITVQTLNEIGKLNSQAGINILGAAVIDDILGLIIISFFLTFADSQKGSVTASLGITVARVFAFCLVTIIAFAFLPKILKKYTEKIKAGSTLLSFCLAFALLCAFAAESLSIAAITGSYLCGLLLSQFAHREWLERNVKAISSGFLAPIFFASVGIEANLTGISKSAVIITIVMFIAAVIGKVLGCFVPARFCKINRSEALQIGIGMISRGEVAIITANIGLQNKIISKEIFMTVILVTILTTIITPILLKFSFSHKITKKLG